MAEMISKGILIADGDIKQYGGSWVVVIAPSYIRDMGIKKPTPCKIFRNLKDQLIIEVTNHEKPH